MTPSRVVRRTVTACATSLCLIAGAVPAARANVQSQEPDEQEFSADRPGFATSPQVLRRGRTQIEGGTAFSVEHSGEGRERTLVLPNPLVRLGIGRATELRFGGDGVRSASSEVSDRVFERTTGWADISVGAKVAIARERRMMPAVSLLPSISLPTGHPAFTSSTYDPSLAVAWLKTLPRSFSIGGTLSGVRLSDGGARYTQYSSAISAGVPLPAHWSGFTEVYGVRSGCHGECKWIMDAGLSRNVGANLQIDISMGRRIYPGAPSWFLAAGFALRVPQPFGT